MTVLAHIDALHAKHTHLESKLTEEMNHPLPFFAEINRIKKQKLKIKEEIANFEASVPRRKKA